MKNRSDPATSVFDRQANFLDVILGAGFVSTLAAVAYPVWRYLIPPVSGEPATQSVVAAKAASVQQNSGLVFKFGRSRPS